MEKILKLHSNQEVIVLYGHLDQNLKYAEKKFQVRISAKNDKLKITGNKNNVDDAYDYFYAILQEYRKSGKTPGDSEEIDENSNASSEAAKKSSPEPVKHKALYYKGRVVQAKSKAQGGYLKAIQTNDIVVAIGPAGTGKTYIAVAAAVQALANKEVKKIILTRPAVEAGESLGFLPGDLAAKVDPYLRPLYDALHETMGQEEVAKCLANEIIEIAPLAYMRGRTLNEAFVILDEGQNTTVNQIKMFLTRLGMNSKMVITGDITQVDLPKGQDSGLVKIQDILKSIKGLAFIYLQDQDVVRHPLVRSIIKAYEKYQQRHA